jgi:hypothetical protein
MIDKLKVDFLVIRLIISIVNIFLKYFSIFIQLLYKHEHKIEL